MTTVSLLSWMLQSTLLLGACWLFYRLLLQTEPAFQFNRGLLLLAPLLATALPLLPLPVGWLAATGLPPGGLLPATWLPEVQVSVDGAPAAAPLPWPALLYGAGVLLSLLAQARHLLLLWRRTRRLPRLPAAGYVLRPTGGRLPTSSFGRQVFWDDTAPLSAAEAAQVLTHELTHVRQGHSADRLWLGFWQALLWFNPFVYLHARALTLTHEFLADAAALPAASPEAADAAPRGAYGALLARQALAHLTAAPALAHSFSDSQTLTRIAMLHHQTPARRWKQWLALPLLGLLLGVVGCEKLGHPAPPPPPPPPAAALPPPPPPPPAPAAGRVLDYADEMPEYAGGLEKLMQDLGTRVKYPAAAARARVEGKVFVDFVVGTDGVLQDPVVKKTISKPHTPALEQELEAAALQAVIDLPGRWTPGRQAGQPVAVSYTIPITFAL